MHRPDASRAGALVEGRSHQYDWRDLCETRFRREGFRFRAKNRTCDDVYLEGKRRSRCDFAAEIWKPQQKWSFAEVPIVHLCYHMLRRSITGDALTQAPHEIEVEREVVDREQALPERLLNHHEVPEVRERRCATCKACTLRIDGSIHRLPLLVPNIDRLVPIAMVGI
mgnify:CR=1 FL=1